MMWAFVKRFTALKDRSVEDFFEIQKFVVKGLNVLFQTLELLLISPENAISLNDTICSFVDFST
jgi:hypothetical protein